MAGCGCGGRRCHEGFQPECVEDDNELLELGGEGVELLVQPVEQAALAIDPGSVIWLGLLRSLFSVAMALARYTFIYN